MQQFYTPEKTKIPTLTVSRDNISATELQDYGDDAFFKVSPQNFLDLQGIIPNRPQIAFLNAANSPEYRFITACISRRLGKTFIANMMAQLVWLVPGCHVLLIAPDYSLAQISWDEQQRLIKKYDIETEVNNSKDRVVHFTNGSMIKVASVNKADSAVGRSYDFILFDETAIAQDARDKFEVALRPTLDRKGATAVFISTPRGDNWFKEYYDRGFDDYFPTWASIHATYHENDRMNEDDVEDARRSMTKSKFAQEYLADFITFEGQIFSEFDPDRHIMEEDLDVSMLEGLGGLDMGFRDHTALCAVKFDYKEEKFYIVDEYVSNQSTTKKHAENIREKMDKWNIDYLYCDPSAAQTRHDFANTYDITTMKANNSKLEGIGFVNTLLAMDKLEIHPSCTNIIKAMRNYRWDPNSQKEKEVHDEHSHPMDAVRYCLYTFGSANIAMDQV